MWRAEEFGIYLNYVRKLGFEETPDYDFLRELFAKVMKNNNDVDDGVYDWNSLNGVYYSLFSRHVRLVLTLSLRWSWLGSRGSKLLSVPAIVNIRLTHALAKQKSDAFPGSEHPTSSITPSRSSKRSPTPGVRTSQSIQGDSSL